MIPAASTRSPVVECENLKTIFPRNGRQDQLADFFQKKRMIYKSSADANARRWYRVTLIDWQYQMLSDYAAVTIATFRATFRVTIDALRNELHSHRRHTARFCNIQPASLVVCRFESFRNLKNQLIKNARLLGFVEPNSVIVCQISQPGEIRRSSKFYLLKFKVFSLNFRIGCLLQSLFSSFLLYSPGIH